MSLSLGLQRLHTKIRAQERYHKHLNRHDYRVLTAKIKEQAKEAVFLENYSDNSTLWGINYKRFWFIAIFDLKTQQIATLLPNSVYNKYKDKIKGASNGRR